MRRIPLWVFCSLVAVSPASAQIGNDPARSPFHDIRNGRYLELFGGRMVGSGGSIPVGPRDGNVVGARVNFRGKNTIQVSFGGWYAGTVRNIVDADDSIAVRVKPAIAHHLLGGEATLQFNLTGGKSWHALAPYVGLGLGVVKGPKTPAADTSGYTFGTKMYFAPTLGTRLMISERMFIKAEGKAYFWSLKYPASYSDEPSKQPGSGDVFNAVNPSGKSSGYAPAPVLLFGIGFAF